MLSDPEWPTLAASIASASVLLSTTLLYSTIDFTEQDDAVHYDRAGTSSATDDTDHPVKKMSLTLKSSFLSLSRSPSTDDLLKDLADYDFNHRSRL